MYLGRSLTAGNYLKLDDLSGSFNGSTATFNLTSGGEAFYPGSVYSILVSLSGVIQEPIASYTINGNQITFATAPSSTDDFFCVVLGVALGVGVPADGTVSGSKLTQPFNYNLGLLYLDTANNRVGIGTTNPQQTLHVVGSGSTTLLVSGNARVTGILTVGSSSVTLDGNNNQVNVGTAVTITNSGFLIGSSNLHSGGLTASSVNVSGVGTFSSLFVSGNVNIAGTVSYEDITNIDSLGIITARTGVRIAADGLVVSSGISTFQGQIQSTQANSTTTGAGQIYLNGATGNRIDFNVNGVAAPTTTTRSAGTKIVLYPTSSPSTQVDAGFGIDNNTLWSSVWQSTASFKWYAATTNIATLFGTGELILGTTSLTGTASQPLQVTGGAYVSGNLGVGTASPQDKLEINSLNNVDVKLRLATSASSFNNFSVIRGIRVSDSQSKLQFQVNNAGIQTAISINYDGNVTIGEQSSTKLNVVGNSANQANFAVPYSLLNLYSNTALAADTGGSITLGGIFNTSSITRPFVVIKGYKENATDSDSKGYLSLLTNNGSDIVEVLRVNSSGNLGIGTTNPQGSLDVHADQNTSTILYVRNPNSGSSARTRIIASSDSGAGSIAMGQHSSNYAGASNQGWLWTSGVSTPLVLGTVGTERVRVTTGGNVGIATTNPQYTLHVVGSFAATTKSFVIDHPTKPNYKLRYASLEGAENGVYVRGRTTENIIELPEYWTELIDNDSITVNLTPIGNKHIWIEEINNNKVYIDSDSSIDCFYTVFAERKDVEKLVVEIEGN
jgi:hypothetical protein